MIWIGKELLLCVFGVCHYLVMNTDSDCRLDLKPYLPFNNNFISLLPFPPTLLPPITITSQTTHIRRMVRTTHHHSTTTQETNTQITTSKGSPHRGKPTPSRHRRKTNRQTEK